MKKLLTILFIWAQANAQTDTLVTLNGSKSYDPSGKPLTYLWTQKSGPTVTLKTPTSAITTYRGGMGEYVFNLKVTNTSNISRDSNTKVSIIRSTPLPIKFGSFTYTQSGYSNTLIWTTLDESDAFSFEVQKSKDGLNFSSIVSIIPKGSPSTYKYTDTSTALKTYYRIKGTEKGGGIVYTNTLSVTYLPVVTNPNVTLTIASNILNYTVKSGFVWNYITITTNTGNQVYKSKKRVFWFPGTHSGNIDISALASGFYLFNVDGYTASFIKR